MDSVSDQVPSAQGTCTHEFLGKPDLRCYRIAGHEGGHALPRPLTEEELTKARSLGLVLLEEPRIARRVL